jgi:hypothetical protein
VNRIKSPDASRLTVKCIVHSSCHEDLSATSDDTAINEGPCAICYPSENVATRKPRRRQPKTIHPPMRIVYFSFFLGRSWLV